MDAKSKISKIREFQPTNPRSLARDWEIAEQFGKKYGVVPHPLGRHQSYNSYGWVDWARLKAEAEAAIHPASTG